MDNNNKLTKYLFAIGAFIIVFYLAGRTNEQKSQVIANQSEENIEKSTFNEIDSDDFSINKDEDYRFNKKEKVINRKLIDNNLKRVIAESANQGGVLQSLNELQMEDLKAMIRTNIFDKG